MLLNSLRIFARDWLPPAIIRLVRSVRKSPQNTGAIAFQGDYETWEDAQAASTGYDQADILEKVKVATLKVKNGEAPYERDSVLFDHIEYSWPVLAGLMWAAAQNQGKLHVLDFGGSLGSSYFQNRRFLSDLTEISWNVIEQPHFVECGRKFIQDDYLKFYLTIDECLEARSPNVILLSSVLQYLEKPFFLLEKLKEVSAKFLIIDRTSFTEDEKNHLVIQTVYPIIYEASYPSWIFSAKNFQDYLSSDWELLSTFDDPEGTVFSEEKFPFFFQGLIYRRKL